MGLTVSVYKKLHRFAVNACFTCPAGKLTALVGPSGAGKTTLIRLIAGLETPDEGTIALDGEVFADTATGRFLPAFKRGVGLVFQEYPLFPHLTVRENILYGAPRGHDPGPLMDTFRIRRLADRRPGAISGGERQRTALCQALARQPRLLLLDEPFSALDQETRAFLCGALARTKGELNIPILHVTHDLGEAHRLADEVIALDEGQIAMDWLERQHIPGRTAPRAVTATLS